MGPGARGRTGIAGRRRELDLVLLGQAARAIDQFGEGGLRLVGVGAVTRRGPIVVIGTAVGARRFRASVGGPRQDWAGGSMGLDRPGVPGIGDFLGPEAGQSRGVQGDDHRRDRRRDEVDHRRQPAAVERLEGGEKSPSTANRAARPFQE